MSSITSAGSSSLDINTIVSQLMQVESRRKLVLQQKEAGFQLKLSSVGQLSSSMSSFKSALDSLRSSSNFQSMKAGSGDSTIFTATASSTAAEGAYNLEVTQLAKANMIASTAYSETTTAIGEGTLTIQVGTGASVDVAIDSTNSSLSGIRDAINSADTDVSASIVNDGTGYKLLLTADDMGSSNTIKVSTSTTSGDLSSFEYDPSGTKNMTEIQAAQSATLKMGSGAGALTITKDSNTVTDVIEGVTITLLKEESGTQVSLAVSNDKTTVSSNVNKFVAEFNNLVNTIKSLAGYDAATESSGPLSGDAIIRQVESEIRRIIGETVPGISSGINSLSQIGISTQSDGTLSVDSSELSDAMTDNFDDIVKLFANVGDATDANINMSSSTDATAAGTYAINITQAATQGDFAGGAAIGSLTISAGSNDTLNLSINGVSTSITIAAGTYASNADLAAEIQSKINGETSFSDAGITSTVTESGGVLTISSSTYGSSSTVGSVSGNAEANLGLDTGVSTDGLDVAGTIGGYAATGAGQVLTGISGTKVEGLVLNILGSTTGNRGSLTYSMGVAETIYQKMDGWLDSGTGIIKTKNDSINASIERIQDAVEGEDRRLVKIEQRLKAQFISLQTLLDTLQSTSDFLTQQMVGLEKLVKGRG